MSDISRSAVKNLFDITGKVFVLAGAGGTVGRRLALLLVDSGAKVAAIDIDPAIEELRVENPSSAGELLTYCRNLTDEAAVKSLAEEVAEDFGGIDVLVNLVCTFGSGKTVFELDYATWKKELDINLNSFFLTCRYFGEKMAAGGGGSIINFASTASYFYVQGSPKAGYCTAKSGVVMLTKSLACEWAEKGIRVNALAPGFIDIRENVRKGDSQRDLNKKERDRIGKIPLGRMAQVMDLFGPIAFLSSEASSYMTGEVVMVDGGHSLSI